MSSSIPGLPLLNTSISNSWKDEELVRFLAERKAGDSLPENVLVGVNLSLLDPCDSENLWYMDISDDQQYPNNGENTIIQSRTGYWKSMDTVQIPTSAAIVGVKVSLDHYKGQAPSGKRTGWVMNQYLVKQNDEANLPQDYKNLCTIFFEGEKIVNAGDKQISVNANAPSDCKESYLQYLAKLEEQNASWNQIVVANEQNDSSSKGQGEQKTSALDDQTVDCALPGEAYIELNDLLSSDASASTSEYSSRRSMISEEYFDSDAFLREIVVANEQNDSSSKGQGEQKTSALDDQTVDCALPGEAYIELNDLLSSDASASTSEYSSRRSMISEEYFDSDAFLREIRNTAAPTKSDRVVISTPEQGFADNHHATVAGTYPQKSVQSDKVDQHSSEESPRHSLASSSFLRSHVKRSRSRSWPGTSKSPQRERSTSKFGKLGKKYCCFGSF